MQGYLKFYQQFSFSQYFVSHLNICHRFYSSIFCIQWKENALTLSPSLSISHWKKKNRYASNVDGGHWYWICRENYLIVNWFSEAWGKGGWKGQLDRNSIKLWNMKENSFSTRRRINFSDQRQINVGCLGQNMQIKAKCQISGQN